MGPLRFFLLFFLPFSLRLEELQRRTRLAYSGKVQLWVIIYSFKHGINHGINLFISPLSRIAGAPNASPRCNRHLDATAARILTEKVKTLKRSLRLISPSAGEALYDPRVGGLTLLAFRIKAP